MTICQICLTKNVKWCVSNSRSLFDHIYTNCANIHEAYCIFQIMNMKELVLNQTGIYSENKWNNLEEIEWAENEFN